MENRAEFAIRSSDVLIIVDVQNDFCADGALAIKDANEIIPRLNDLSLRFLNVVVTQDWHPPGHISFASSHPGRLPLETINTAYGNQELWPDHCIQGTWGADLHPDLAAPHAALILRKGFRKGIDSYSAFFESDGVTPTGLAGYLRERALERVFICGLAFDFCVRFSAEDAGSCGFVPVVIEDLCRAVGDDPLKARGAIQSAGIPCITRNRLIS